MAKRCLVLTAGLAALVCVSLTAFGGDSGKKDEAPKAPFKEHRMEGEWTAVPETLALWHFDCAEKALANLGKAGAEGKDDDPWKSWGYVPALLRDCGTNNFDLLSERPLEIVPGKFGNGAEMSTDSCMKIPFADHKSLSGGSCVDLWVKPSSAAPSKPQVIWMVNGIPAMLMTLSTDGTISYKSGC